MLFTGFGYPDSPKGPKGPIRALKRHLGPICGPMWRIKPAQPASKRRGMNDYMVKPRPMPVTSASIGLADDGLAPFSAGTNRGRGLTLPTAVTTDGNLHCALQQPVQWHNPQSCNPAITFYSCSVYVRLVLTGAPAIIGLLGTVDIKPP